MSFDVFFRPCRYDGTTERRRNPFTNKIQEFPRNGPLSEVEVSAVRDALERAGARGPDDDGTYVAMFADGANAEIFADNLANGCMFAIRGAGVTPSLARLLFEVMVAGNWVLTGTGEENLVLAPTLECVKGAPNDFPRVVVARSAREVQLALASGFEGFRHYRDQILA